MKPKKPHPRKPYERPDLRRMAAPPPRDFYRLPGHGRHPGNIVWRGTADRILRGEKIDPGRAVYPGGTAQQVGGATR